jgi:hypothetical protein
MFTSTVPPSLSLSMGHLKLVRVSSRDPVHHSGEEHLWGGVMAMSVSNSAELQCHVVIPRLR